MLNDAQTMPQKCLASMFLIVLSVGFLTAHLLLHHSVNNEDGKDTGVPSLRDITLHFHGDPGTTRLRNKINGSMKKYFSASEDAKDLSEEEKENIKKVLDWNDRGAPENEFWEFNPDRGRQSFVGIGLILMDSSCLDCHTRTATMKGNNKKSPLDSYTDIVKFTKEDTGMSKGTLLMLSHVHLLGMSLMFLGVGFFLARTRWPSRWRTALILSGFASILMDVGGWWAVKFGGATWAALVMAGGGLMGLSFALSVLLVLYDIWFKGKEPEAPAAA